MKKLTFHKGGFYKDHFQVISDGEDEFRALVAINHAIKALEVVTLGSIPSQYGKALEDQILKTDLELKRLRKNIENLRIGESTDGEIYYFDDVDLQED